MNNSNEMFDYIHNSNLIDNMTYQSEQEEHQKIMEKQQKNAEDSAKYLQQMYSNQPTNESSTITRQPLGFDSTVMSEIYVEELRKNLLRKCTPKTSELPEELPDKSPDVPVKKDISIIVHGLTHAFIRIMEVLKR